MGMIEWIKRLFGLQPDPQAADTGAETFIFIVIRDSLGPLDRGAAYEDPLDHALKELGLGEVTGGGSQLGDELPDGGHAIAWCGIDVETPEPAKRSDTLRLLRTELQRLGAPTGSELHYTESGVRLRDHLGDGGWEERLPRQDVHPGFGF